jgi:histidinol dehydrogenase
VAADHCGAHEIYWTGGAQAVAALAYGTTTIPHVDKIVGPGGAVVTAAKRMVSADIPVDMEAGPTELGIVADGAADPDVVALDLISQAEHSPDTFCFVLTDSEALARRVAGAVESRLDTIERSDIVRESLDKNGFVAVFEDVRSAVSAAERLAPEHLQVMTGDPERDAASLDSPGLILLGHETPSAASDYMLGSNHILPTGRQGRVRGPLSVLDYTKMRVTARADHTKMSDILDRVGAVTGVERLPNHYAAVRGRVP